MGSFFSCDMICSQTVYMFLYCSATCRTLTFSSPFFHICKCIMHEWLMCACTHVYKLFHVLNAF